jgi:hypothetical protein
MTVDPKREAKRIIADSHVENGTVLAPDLVLSYGINLIDLRSSVDEDGDLLDTGPPAMRITHEWGDELASVHLLFTTDSGGTGAVVRQLDAEQLAGYLEEAAKNLRMRDLGNLVVDA